jgi:YVTN family beta-propeller protein
VAFDGTHVWVVNTNSNTVTKINPATNTITATVPVGLNPLGIAHELRVVRRVEDPSVLTRSAGPQRRGPGKAVMCRCAPGPYDACDGSA